MKYTYLSYREISKVPYLRLVAPFQRPYINYEFIPFLEIIDSYDTGSRPKGGIQHADFGQALSIGGEHIGQDGLIDLNNPQYVSYDFYNSSLKGKILDEDILVCKDGALTGKTCLVDMREFNNDKVMANEHVYIFRGNQRTRQRFLYYLMRTKLFHGQIKNLAYKKKGQPGLNSDHLALIRVPDVPIAIQDDLLLACRPYEERIVELMALIRPLANIINDVFCDNFTFDFEEFQKLKSIRCYNTTTNVFSNNQDLRFGVKFHREAGNYVMHELARITDKKIKHFLSEPIVLGSSISPTDYSDDTDCYYVSMATIKTWEFSADSANTVSDIFATSKVNKTVKKDDIILARSGEGTIGKCALIEDEGLYGVFADFTMRFRFKNYSAKFAYYYFRTTYFQYLIEIYKKGLGNNTNIFPVVVQEFPLIDIPQQEQQRIVDEIQIQIGVQNSIKTEIANLRAKLDSIIESALS